MRADGQTYRRTDRQTEEQTYITKLTVTFRNFANVPKNCTLFWVCLFFVWVLADDAHYFPILKERKLQSQTYTRQIYTTKKYMRIGLLKHSSRIRASWKLKTILEVVAWPWTHDLVPLNGSYLTRWKIRGIIMITCFCCFMMWTCRPGFIWDPYMNNGAPPHFLLADREFLKNLNGSNWHFMVDM